MLGIYEYYNEILLTDRGHTGKEACLGPDRKRECCRFVELEVFVACGDVQKSSQEWVKCSKGGRHQTQGWKMRFKAIGVDDLLGLGYRIISGLFGGKHRN